MFELETRLKTISTKHGRTLEEIVKDVKEVDEEPVKEITEIIEMLVDRLLCSDSARFD